LIKLPLKLLLFPIRKIMAWLGAIRTLAADLSMMLLLGRALDRTLTRGMLSEPDTLEQQAKHIRLAYEGAADGFDLSLLRRHLARALGKVSGLVAAAARAARRLFRRGAPDDVKVELGSERETVEAGASQVEAVLNDPEVIALIERFDSEFDRRLLALEGESPKAT
jgi:hypothetical protein